MSYTLHILHPSIPFTCSHTLSPQNTSHFQVRKHVKTEQEFMFPFSLPERDLSGQKNKTLFLWFHVSYSAHPKQGEAALSHFSAGFWKNRRKKYKRFKFSQGGKNQHAIFTKQIMFLILAISQQEHLIFQNYLNHCNFFS